jgi:hypothetical protein
MGLSPSTLFHFTNKEGLFGLLADNFKIKYCLEQISHNEQPVEIAIPMVSFCDIKISEISEHISKYGQYGIGLDKKWAVEKGLNPVIYMNSSSSFCNDTINVIRKINQIDSIPPMDRYRLSNIMRYTKIYEGELTRQSETIPNYRFADEREWRYVPEMKENATFKHWLLKNEYDTAEKKRAANEKLSRERLYFNPNNIMYLIVKDESEIIELIQHIRSVKGINFTMHEVDRLTTRILTCERILNDF